MRVHDCGYGISRGVPSYGDQVSTQQRSTGGRTEDDPPTGVALLPVLQVLSLVCLAFVGLQFLFREPRGGAWAGCVLTTAGVVGVMWMVRRRVAAGRARAACSVAVLVLLTGPALLGTLGFIVPALIMAAALLVIDVGVRASLVGDAVMPAASAALMMFVSVVKCSGIFEYIAIKATQRNPPLLPSSLAVSALGPGQICTRTLAAHIKCFFP